MSERDLRGLAELLDKHSSQETIRKGTGYYQEAKDFDFHFRIIQASANPRLIEMLCGELYDQLRIFRYKSSTKPGRAQQAFSEHQDILAALMAREPDRAEAAMRQHIRNARKHIEQHVLEADGKAAETTRVNTERADTPADTTRMRPRGEWVAGKTSLLVGDRRRSKPG
jgi:DNA-binding GntR family transcriptional regulator